MWLRQYLMYRIDFFLVNIWFFGSILQAHQYIVHGKVSVENKTITNSSYILTINKLVAINTNLGRNLKFLDIQKPKTFFVFDTLLCYSFTYRVLFFLYIQNTNTVHTYLNR
jgi:ribosomal protein S4